MDSIREITALAAASLVLSALGSAQEIQPRMGAPLPGLDAAQLANFAAGKVVFDTQLTPAQGLGPIFNNQSCKSCHLGPQTGGSSSIFVTRFGVAATGSTPFDPLDNLGGSLLESFSINSPGCDEVVPPQADVVIHRITPPTFGFGLVEAILDGDILVNEVFPPPGVHGHTHMVAGLEDPPGSPLRVGRFGWKSQVATVLSFSSDASLNEMGLTNRFLPVENAPNGDLARLAQCDSVQDPEDPMDSSGKFLIDRMTDFQRYLAPPPQTPRTGMHGEQVFNAVGCASCHLSAPFLASSLAEPGIANVNLKPYSDFLVHDMGSLGDGIAQGAATETEMRTAPLWGVAFRAPVALLHDGRASGASPGANIQSAILAHDGEGLASANAYSALSAADKTALQNFLLSLGRLEFDFEANNNVDEVDWFFLYPLVNGPAPAVPYTPDSVGAVADFDQDGDFDLEDFGVLQRAFTGP
ncbi:MAG: hypothetical protein IPJ19_05860 [Planctomycetes bacterium]|nr:hypothetical protein [Planctomycetota bacterium]